MSTTAPDYSATRYLSRIAAALLLVGCSAVAPGNDTALVGADETSDSLSQSVSGSIPIGTKLKTTANLNFRKGPSTSYGVIRVLASGTVVVTVEQTTPTNKYYKVQHNGTTGWTHGSYLSKADGDTSPPESSTPVGTSSGSKRDAAIARAKSGVGFSYWWGGARWLPSGPTSSTKGSCSGSCPSCSHSGSYGADCSGYVGKIWQVPSSNDDLTVNYHPYSTASFAGTSSLWSKISRSNLLPADALVYRTSSSGHIMLYGGGDGWGSTWAYECKSCKAGCVHDLRSVSSSYTAKRRTGY